MMLKTFKHPLYKREIVQVRWTALLLTISILLPIFVALNNLRDDFEYSWTMETMDLLTEFPLDFFAWLVIPILIISQFFYTRKESVIGIIASLPYSRSESIRYKYLAGITGIFFSYCVALLVFTVTYYSAGNLLLGPYVPLFYWFLVALMFSIVLYSFCFLVATVMGNSIFAGVASFFIFYVPVFLTASVLMHLDLLFDIYVDFEAFYQVLLPHYISYTGAWYKLDAIPFTKIIPILAGYLLAAATLFKLAEHFYNRNDFEHNGNMCMFVWAEKVFLVGFTLCFGFLGLDFAQMFQGGWLYPVSVLLGLACFPLGYIFSKKLLQITGHQIRFRHN